MICIRVEMSKYYSIANAKRKRNKQDLHLILFEDQGQT